MSYQADLFSETDMPTPVVNLKIAGQKLSPEQTRFNKLLARCENLSRRIEEIQRLADAHRPVHASVLLPLQAQYDESRRELARFLHRRLVRKGLTRQQRRIAADIVCAMADDFAAAGDAEMQALFETHSGQTLDERDQAAAVDARLLFEEMLGIELGEAADLASPEEVIRAAYEKLQEQQAARRAKRAARKAKRGPNAKEQQAEQKAQDANSALRTVYRQLASALHPDRESDPAERDRKTAFMGEANIAYERRDFSALLKLQMRIEQIEPGAVARLASDKLAAFGHLLNEQVGALSRDLTMAEQRVRQEFNLGFYGAVTEISLQRHLQDKQAELRSYIAALTQDLQRIQDDKALKEWLKEQNALAKQNERNELMGAFGHAF